MSKESDRQCHNCGNYDTCDRKGSNGCTQYEFYKCRGCSNRIETDGTAKCFRGGQPCSDIKFCNQ